MSDARLAWEPVNITPLREIEDRLAMYMKGHGGVTIMKNGTLLFITKGNDDVEDAKKALNEARHITNFRVVAMREGGYLVAFHDAVAVFVGHEEFAQLKSEITIRQADLRFPDEVFILPESNRPQDILIGLYARGKLQRDAYFFNFYKRL